MGEKHKIVSHWVQQYGDQLYSWAFYRTSNDAVSADLVQETFLSAFQHYDRFKGSSAPRTWLFSILKNKVTDHFRAVMKSKSMPLDSWLEKPAEWFDENGKWKKEHAPEPWQMEDNNLLDDVAFKGTLARCMGSLPSTWASCLQLKYLSEKESIEICQELNLTPSNFWQILHRAKLHLRACLEKNWFKP